MRYRPAAKCPIARIGAGFRSCSAAKVLLFAVLASGACASPTLPLPPPDAPTVEAGTSADYVKLVAACGAAEANAILIIINENPALAGDLAVSGSRASSCGAWDAEVYAHSGDVLSITQEVGTDGSQAVAVLVR